jgi:SAM-dependent methyltransferase
VQLAKAGLAIKFGVVKSHPYESQEYLDQYLLFHYGTPRQLCAAPFIDPKELQFHRRILRECLLPLSFPGPTRGLDIGCSVGRFTFELGRVVDEVVGIDNSKAFIEAAQRMAKAGCAKIRVKESGAAFRPLLVKLPKVLRKSRVEFQVGDALDLARFMKVPAHLVAVLNVLCRLPSPRTFLAQLQRVVVPGGQLVLASPFSWLEEFTPQKEWLSSAEMTELLRPHFRLARRRELPFFIREHRRKYQMVLSEVSVFVRR